jgi:Domain of unknown function (DUF4263)
VGVNLETVVFDPAQFEKELNAFEVFLKSRTDLSETTDIQPFFKKNKHLAVYMGTIFPEIGPATEITFEYPFFGDFKADLLLGNKSAKKFCVAEFEDGCQDSIFKKQPKRGNPEWSARFEHGFSQLTDWFYNLDDFKGSKGFAKTFGDGHVKFFGLLVIGRNANLDTAKRSRLDWRTEKVLIDSHPVTCLTFDDLHASLRDRFIIYRAAAKLETKKKKTNK